MKVILTSNIRKLGKIGDLVNVKSGFARNYLFPQNKALRETKKNLEHFKKLKEEIIAKEKIQKDKAEIILTELEDVKIVFIREADDNDQLYGSVSVKDIQMYLSEKNIKISPEDILINNPIKSIGKHKILISPYDNLSKELDILVTQTKQ